MSPVMKGFRPWVLLIAAAVLVVMASLAHAATTVSGKVSWTAPATDVNGNPANVTSYNIYAGTSVASLVKVGSTTGGVTSFTQSGVVPGTVLYVTVTAVNAAGESAYGNVATFSPTVPQGLPGAPTNVTITVIISP